MADLILEWLQWQMGCTYLSDLPDLHGKKRQHMITLLHSIPPDVATLEEWRDIYRYLNSAPIIVPDE